VGGPGREDQEIPAWRRHGSRDRQQPGGGTPLHTQAALFEELPERRRACRCQARDHDAVLAIIEEALDDGPQLARRLTGPIHELELSLAQPSMVIDSGKTEIGERQSPQRIDAVADADVAAGDALEERSETAFVRRGPGGPTPSTLRRGRRQCLLHRDRCIRQRSMP